MHVCNYAPGFGPHILSTSKICEIVGIFGLSSEGAIGFLGLASLQGTVSAACEELQAASDKENSKDEGRNGLLRGLGFPKA